MLQEIRLNNYKCFLDSGRVEIKPLTVLCGVNSSGKSTILKSLLTLKQTYNNAGNKPSIVLNSDHVKNGTFDDVVYKREGNYISFTTTHRVKSVSRKEKRGRAEIITFKNIAKMYPDYDKISELIIAVNYTFLRTERDNTLSRQEYDIKVVYVDGNYLKSKVTFEHIDGNDWRITIENFPNKDGALIEQMKLNNATCYFENFIVANLYVGSTKPHTNEVVYIVNNICTVSRYVGSLFQNINYLTPLRVYPQRTYLNENIYEGIGIGGENTAQFLSEHQEEKMKTTLFGPNGTKEAGQALGTYVNQWMDYFGLGEYKLSQNEETVKISVGNDNIINVGFGVSQTLPIIVTGLTMHAADTLLLEQPEIHLHPRAQMAMGDFLISMVKAQKNVVVETHSDHIINRIVRRIMDGTIDDKDVAIYFVSGSNNGSEINKIEVDMVRGIVNAPDDFFTQFASELNDIFKTGMENLKKTRQ